MEAKRMMMAPCAGAPAFDDGSPITQFLLTCLRASAQGLSLTGADYWTQEPGFAWDELRTMVQAERVGPLLYQAVRGQTWLPNEIEQELRSDYVMTAGRNALLFMELERVITLLAQAGIEVIPLKGAALIGSVYQTIAVRPMFDLDLLVKHDQAGRAITLLTQNGYAQSVSEPRMGTLLDYENEAMLIKTDHSAFPIELHWSLIDSPFYQRTLDMEWFWQTPTPGQIGDAATRFLGNEAMLLHLCAHLALHHRGCGLLWLHDVAAFVHTYGEQIDWVMLISRARQFGLVLSLRTVIPLVAKHWQAPVPGAFLDQLAALPVDAEEQRAFDSTVTPPEAVAQRFLQDVAGLQNWHKRSDFILRNLFPTQEYMRWRYAISKEWMIPLYYPYRWLLGIASALRPKR